MVFNHFKFLNFTYRKGERKDKWKRLQRAIALECTLQQIEGDNE